MTSTKAICPGERDLNNERQWRMRAFGPLAPLTPGVRAFTSRERWLHGVCLGACGYYAAAVTELRPLCTERAARGDPLTASLAASTLASHRRQIGAHDVAMDWDGRALRWALQAENPDEDGARLDALLGLAADHLGSGEVARTCKLLSLSREVLHQTGTDEVTPSDNERWPIWWRSITRLGWVTAEWWLAQGRPEHALVELERINSYRAYIPSLRHIIKTEMVMAAVRGMMETDRGRMVTQHLCRSVITISLLWGMVPLVWPTSQLLQAADGVDTSNWIRVGTDALTSAYDRMDAAGRRMAQHSPWMPNRLLRVGE